MEVGAKLALIQQLGVVPVCARWQAGLPAVAEEPELAVKYARWVRAACRRVGGCPRAWSQGSPAWACGQRALPAHAACKQSWLGRVHGKEGKEGAWKGRQEGRGMPEGGQGRPCIALLRHAAILALAHSTTLCCQQQHPPPLLPLSGCTPVPRPSRLLRLLAALATEVLEAWKKVENSVLSMAAVGLEVDAEAASEAGAACATAGQLMDALFPAVLAALRAGNDEVAAAVVPFLLSYVARLKALQKRGGAHGALPPGQAAHVPAILESLAACARFPDDSAAYEVAASSATER